MGYTFLIFFKVLNNDGNLVRFQNSHNSRMLCALNLVDCFIIFCYVIFLIFQCPIFRYVRNETGVQPIPFPRSGVPQDFIHLASGEDPYKLVDLLRLVSQTFVIRRFLSRLKIRQPPMRDQDL